MDSAQLSCFKNPSLAQANHIHLSPSYRFGHTGWWQMWKNIHSILPSKPHPSKVYIVVGVKVLNLGLQETFSLDRNGQGLTIHYCRSPKHITTPESLACSFLRILSQITMCRSLKTIFFALLSLCLGSQIYGSVMKSQSDWKYYFPGGSPSHYC
jgi:hypothetical protein